MARRSRGAGGLVLSMLAGCLMLTGCGSTHPAVSGVSPAGQIPESVLKGLRPIGRGERFHPPVRGLPTGTCAARPGGLEAHLELFGANRVVLIAAGVGQRGGCYGNAVTTDPTGIVHFRAGATLADVFRAWGEPLGGDRMASFTGPVRYYVAGHRVTAVPALTEHAQIVIEVGPYVPPHATFSFPRGL